MTMGDRVAVMSQGVLEQVGDARTVYDEPANVFVAGFIGSPAMSFATVRAEGRGDLLALVHEGMTLEVPVGSQVATGLPSEVVLGVRPEHARLWRDGAGLVGPVDGRVAYVEMLGRETFIGAQTAGDAQFTLHAEPDAAVRQGEAVRFGFEPGRLYLFDPGTQQAIARV
jgi:ABC-type sugar transport system ATPase subunit